MKLSTAACDNRFSRTALPPRIIIQGAGFFGGLFSQQAMKKGWPIVAAVANRAGEKIGQDWGRLSGSNADIGISVQDSEAVDYREFRADIAVVTMGDRLTENMPIYRRLLGAGVNVLCLGCESYFPQAINRDIADEIDSIAKANDATFTGTGTWDYSRIWPGIITAGACMHIESMDHSSVTNLGEVGNYARDVGIGLTQEEFNRQIVANKSSRADGFAYHLILQAVLSTLGYEITDVVETPEPVLYDHKVFCAGLDRYIEPGICAGLRKNIVVRTQQGVTATAKIELRVIEAGEVEHMRWSVEGAPGTDITVSRRNNTALATAACLINRVPDVIAARPGVQLITQLCPLRSTSLL